MIKIAKKERKKERGLTKAVTPRPPWRSCRLLETLFDTCMLYFLYGLWIVYAHQEAMQFHQALSLLLVVRHAFIS
jgi:hypothetical protein